MLLAVMSSGNDYLPAVQARAPPAGPRCPLLLTAPPGAGWLVLGAALRCCTLVIAAAQPPRWPSTTPLRTPAPTAPCRALLTRAPPPPPPRLPLRRTCTSATSTAPGCGTC
jgi:hypothetical protein